MTDSALREKGHGQTCRTVRRGVYGKAAAHAGIDDANAISTSLAKRIEEMYASGLLSMRSRHDEIIEKSYQKGGAS